MKKKWLIGCLCLTGFVWAACFNAKKQSTAEQVLALYKKDLARLVKEVNAFEQIAATSSEDQRLQEAFKAARYAYKKVEWLAEYYQPYTTRFINGPALEEVEPEDKSVVIQPEGFQVIEELIFPVCPLQSKDELIKQVKLLQSNVGRLATTAATLETSDAHIFDALRLQLFRIIALGITGFDSPVAQNSIAETNASLKAIQEYVSVYRSEVNEKDKALSPQLDELFSGANSLLSAATDFAAFNRMQFITGYVNPLSETLLEAQKLLGFPFFTEPRALKADAKTLFAATVFNPDFYTPDAAAHSTEAKRRLGAQLFYDPALSSNGSRSCASCHQPGKAFADGLKTNSVLGTSVALRRNTPSLLNAALQPALFYDTRLAYLEDQAGAVIVNKDEMHGSFEKAVAYLKSNEKYKRLFAQAYPGGSVSEKQIKNAIASYVRSIIALNSRFDQYMRGQKSALNPIEIDGFNLFMGKAKCGTCHFAPLFNGSNPPNFTEIDAEVIGVPSTSDTLHARLDSDEGKYEVHQIALYRHAFKTPTVRNIALTAPYMHNGVFNTLEEVVDFYNRGGGRGLGLPVKNQTLPEDRLNLSSYEKKAIVAFLGSLTDTVLVHK